MFRLGVKVLFWRQLFGFKHRKVFTVISLIIPVLYALLLRVSLTESKEGEESNTVQRNLYSENLHEDPGFFRFPYSLTVIVTPKNMGTSSLMIKARSVLQQSLSDSSSPELHLRFSKSLEDLNRSLADSVRPSIGVEFHNMTKHQLKYTLRPVIASDMSNNFTGAFDNDISPYSLLLRAAIDAAYMQTYFPDQSSFLKLLNFDEKLPGNRKITRGAKRHLYKLAILLSHFLVSNGIVILLIFLASYNVRDKSNGVRELLCINGLPRWMVNTSWLFTFSILATMIALVELMILKIPDPRLTGITTPALLVYLIVYHLTATFSVYFLANIFASQIACVLLILAYYVVISPIGWGVLQLEEYFVLQAFISLLPNIGGYMFCVAAVESYVEFNRGISIHNMFSSSEKFISPGGVLIMMIISIFIYLVLGLYLDAVKPGPYGRARPWYLFTRKEKPTTDRWFEAIEPSAALAHEPIKDGVPMGLKCVNIVKKFGTHKALNKVNLGIIKNNITVLLGHNGAGKTTLFSILCGIFSPTSGEVFADEYNVFEGENINKFRSVLGYCSQENILMEELTVHEHLIVFGLLKGLVMSEAVDSSDVWTQRFDMYAMRYTQTKNLSGGSKRKLCLAIAMTGNPQYLLLDEPSAGLDIESTKKLSDILLEEKGNCTVILTTHNMDEAEMLGERIAILAHGELKCFGSISFLKKMLDTGYRLNCSIIRGMSIQDAIKAVTNIIPGTNVLYRTNHSVTFSLPVNKTSDIPDLLHRLESQFGAKMSSTLSSSTLDDVFLKVQTDMGVKVTVNELPTISEGNIRRSCWNFIELFKKRAKWILTPKRMLTMFFYVILLPNVVRAICIAVSNSLIETTPNDDSSTRSFLINYFSKGGQRILALVSPDAYNAYFGQSNPAREAFREKSKNINSTAGDTTYKYLFKYGSKILFALDTQSSDTPITYSPDEPSHDVSKIYSALINALIQGNATIITYNAPVMKQHTFNHQLLYPCPLHDAYIEILQAFLVAVFSSSFLFATSYFVVSPHQERITVFKHLQLMTGLLPVSYWLANLVFDMLIYIASCVLIIIITTSMDRTNLFLQSDTMYAFILILFMYGLSGTTYSYVWSFAFRSSGVAFFALVFFNIALTLIVSITFTNIWPWPEIDEYLDIILPYHMLDASMIKLIDWAIKKRDCGSCPLANHEEGCFYTHSNPVLEVLKSSIITLAVQAIVWFALLLLFDHGMGRKLKGGIAKVCCGDIRVLSKDVDPEVALERKRLKDLVMKNNKDKKPELIVNGLGKNYGCAKTAVYDVTFAAERGECFGLLGVNGSGKTTTFGMLAALISPTKGTAVIEGTWKVNDCEYNYMKRVGYCPQYNGLLKELSGRTILKLFGRLCGVRRNQINEMVDKWINALDMAEIATRPCGQYSGGNKRKLSLAIALMGNAPVALLDEPTAGVDPVVRRRIWAILTSRLEQNQTVILTSHTMSECEAICDRLTIMVKGVMKCLGPIPMLKKTFGKRSILTVKFTANSTIQEQDVVKAKIESEFGSYLTLEDRLLTRLIFNLNTENSKMYDLFSTMLRIQSDYKIVDDFSLVEAPLEQVFMMFATKKTLNKKY